METAKHYLGFSDSQMLEMEIHRVVKSPDIQDRMEKCYLHWKRLESMDEEKSIICRLE